LQTADSDLANNTYPRGIASARFALEGEKEEKNPMQKAGLGKQDDKALPSEEEAP
jgi:hypothetical protein